LSERALRDFGQEAITQQRRGQERSLGFLFRRDERDSFLYPNTGYFLEVEPEFFIDIFGGTSDFYRVEGTVSKYWRVLGGATLAGRVKVGSIHYYDGVTGFVPDYELFYLGGATSVRGFPSDRLHTREIQTEDGTRRVASGNFVKLLGNLELRFPIYWKFGGELFLDAGQLWPDYSSLNILTMRYTTGIGITFATPLGPARVDFGRKLGPLKPHERPWVTNLALQYAF
jgi:outer membrane protein assembly factor BamA